MLAALWWLTLLPVLAFFSGGRRWFSSPTTTKTTTTTNSNSENSPRRKSSNTTITNSSSPSTSSIGETLSKFFSTIEQAIHSTNDNTTDISKRIASSTSSTAAASVESGEQHGKILFFRKCSMSVVENTIRSEALENLILKFNENSDRVSIVNNVNELIENEQVVAPFEGLEFNNLLHDGVSDMDEYLRVNLVEVMFDEKRKLANYLKENITVVELTNCGLKRIPIEFLSQFKQLTSINLSSNAIEEISEEFFKVASLCPLKVLNLSNNNIKRIPKYFSNLFIQHSLLTLNVQENYIDLADAIPIELKYITGREKSQTHHNEDFSSPIKMSIKKNSPKARLSFSKVLTKKGSHNSHNAMRFLCHMQRVPQRIADRLYLGSVTAATNIEELKSIGINSILCVNVISPFPDEEERSRLFKNYKQISETDEEKTNIMGRFDEALDWIDECLNADPSNKVLVHCSAGMSRSATIIIAYVMNRMKMSAEEAFVYVRDKRCCIAPNTGFLLQIQLYEDIGKDFKGPNFESYVQRQIFNYDENHHSAMISLNYLKLKEFPPKFLFIDPSLTEPEEIENYKKSTEMKFSQRLSKLLMLELQWNQISCLSSLFNYQVESLVELDLSHNLLETIPLELLTLPQLRILNLSFNNLKQLPTVDDRNSELIPNKIVDLRLGHNKIEKITNANCTLFSTLLRNLEMLDLSHNELCEIPSFESCFSHLSHLRVLSLYQNEFSEEPNVVSKFRESGKIVYYSTNKQSIRQILNI
ncbi:predicted protein [Naegleria gruberi]|uniref:protein-tyrosine-phosphatase n=1 Tax=Naegleria gruberi TaxID=5762 RepID=D2VPV3_NAEGR|nr:uncharacterized protein NAEGRDRAFT_70998 [Naegleria gruberi]EFC41270.1 predicted protein [Naegleria gruberi]|eukprot:XP_002674014.1 predicted protein [Naegleria gruberi strain NEG-M]